MKNDNVKKTLLIIDDTKPIRILIWKTFDKEYNVLMEAKVSQALETVRLRHDNIDLIILDYEMPEMNGDVLYSHIRKYCPEVPVIILSGSLSESRIARMRALGIKQFLSKPVNIKRLREEIGKIISNDDNPA